MSRREDGSGKLAEWSEAIREEIEKWRQDRDYDVALPVDLDRDVYVTLVPPVRSAQSLMGFVLSRSFHPKKEEALFNPTLKVTA